MSQSNERSAEFCRGAVHVAFVLGDDGEMEHWGRLLAAAEAREAGENQALPLGELQRKHGELACELLSAAEVIEAAEKALRSWIDAMNTHGEWDGGCFYYCKRSASELESRVEGNTDALALITRWKEANGG